MNEITINRVSNGFVLRDGQKQEYRISDGSEFQVAATPDEIADLVRAWADGSERPPASGSRTDD